MDRLQKLSLFLTILFLFQNGIYFLFHFDLGYTIIMDQLLLRILYSWLMITCMLIDLTLFSTLNKKN